MAEETTTEENKPDFDVLEEAKRINEETKKQNEIKAKLLDREEKLLARQETLRSLGGGSPAGQVQEKPKVETAAEYAERVLSGKYPR